jgi:phage I-like protein
MKTKKVLAFMLLFAAVSIVAVFAQRPNVTPEQRAKAMTERMKKQLNLTDDQVVKLDSINLQFAQEQMKARESGNDVREAMRAASEKYTATLKGILTPDQFQQWQDARKKMMERMQQMQQSQGDQPAPPQN